MPISLPAGLSKPLVDFAAQEADMGETCEFEAGEDRRAPISTTVPSSVEVRWHMTQAQFDLFDAWFEDDLFAGSLTFDLPVPIQGGTLTELQEAMFLEPPECTCVHKDNWEVSAKCVIGFDVISVFFRDTFTGESGPLSSHSPDVSPAGFVWTSVGWTTRSLVLTGAGEVQADEANDGGADSQGSSPATSVSLPSSGYSLEIVATPSSITSESAWFSISSGNRLDNALGYDDEANFIQVGVGNGVEGAGDGTYVAYINWFRTDFGSGPMVAELPDASEVTVRATLTENSIALYVNDVLATLFSGGTNPTALTPITNIQNIGIRADAHPTGGIYTRISRVELRL